MKVPWNFLACHLSAVKLESSLWLMIQDSTQQYIYILKLNIFEEKMEFYQILRDQPFHLGHKIDGII